MNYIREKKMTHWRQYDDAAQQHAAKHPFPVSRAEVA